MNEATPEKRRDASEVDVDHWLRRLDDLRGRRTHWDSHWREVAERVWPQSDEFPGSRRSVHTGGGEKRTEKIFDSTASRALWKLAAALESLLIPRAQKWHRLRASDEALNKDPATKFWFEELTRVLFAARSSPRASYYAQMHEAFMSLGAFGNQCVFLDEGPRGGIRYLYCHIGQVYIETDDHRRIVAIYRVFPLSASAAFKRWGRRSPPKVLQALEKNPGQIFEFLHVVAPRGDVDPERLGPERMAYLSLRIAIEDRVVLEQGGYHELPYVYSRWSVGPSEDHGRSPAMEVLPEIKGVNAMKRDYLQFSRKAADPPLLVHDDGVVGVGSRTVRLNPGGLTYGGVTSEGRPLVQPLISGSRPEMMQDIMEAEREAINDAFLISLFRILVEDPRSGVTATEILQRMQEKGELLAPTIGRQQSELLGPQIEREIAILLRQGVLPPPPPALLEAQGEYEIEYVSPATQFQRAGELVGVQRTIEIALPFVQVDPTVLLKFKPSEIIDLAAEIQGAPSRVLRTEEEFAEAIEAQRQAQLAAAMPAQLAEGAGALRDGAQAVATLAETGAQRAA